VQWGICTPKPRMLSTSYNGVLVFYKQNFDINKAFKPKLSGFNPQAKFLATPLLCATTTLEILNLWPLLTGGCFSEVTLFYKT